MMHRLLYIDPTHRCSTLISRLRRKGIACRSLADEPRQMLEMMLENDNVLLVACDNLVRTPMVAAASSWMSVVAFEAPVVSDTQWITLTPTMTEDEQLEVLLGTLHRGDHGRKRTRISIPLTVWIKGQAYPVSNASLRELWIQGWSESTGRSTVDGMLELAGEQEKIPFTAKLVALRDDGCALQFAPSSDMGLLKWLDYFLDGLQKTPVHERVEPTKEFFEEG